MKSRSLARLWEHCSWLLSHQAELSWHKEDFRVLSNSRDQKSSSFGLLHTQTSSPLVSLFRCFSLEQFQAQDWGVRSLDHWMKPSCSENRWSWIRRPTASVESWPSQGWSQLDPVKVAEASKKDQCQSRWMQESRSHQISRKVWLACRS